jgi:hypothetical protein
MKACNIPRLLFGAVLVLTLSVLTASAQPAESTTPPPSQTTTQANVETSFWEPIGGVEVDTHGTGYMFFGPTYQRQLRDNLRMFARVNGNYLMYEFEELGGMTKVRSPGVSSMAGLRFGGANWFQVGAGLGAKRRTEKFFVGTGGNPLAEDTDWQLGLDLAADAYLNPTSRTNVHAMVNYGTADNYLWSRLAAKRQISNYSWSGPFAHFVGAEIMGQGNDDIRSIQVGGLLEFLHVKSSASIGLRAGWKQSTFDFGPDKTGPYFGVGYYQRIR